MLASKFKHDSIVKALIAARADVNSADNNGQSPLMLASEVGNHRYHLALNALIAAGAVHQ